MDKMMMKMMNKEDDGGDLKKDAKLSVLKELRKMASDMMGEDLKGGFKKVTVAAPDKEGLKEGLDKAKSLMGEMPEEESAEEDAGEMGEEGESEEMSAEDIDAQIQHLMEMKKKLSK